MLFSHFFSASFYREYRQHLADEERREDQGGPEDLESDETVAGEPVPEEGGEDGLHGQDHRRPGRRDALLDEGLHPERPRRCNQARRHEGEPDLPWREGDRLEEGPKDPEDHRYREHLGEGEPRRVVSGGVAGEESYVQAQRGGAQEGE